jgi:hypothetical protein
MSAIVSIAGSALKHDPDKYERDENQRHQQPDLPGAVRPLAGHFAGTGVDDKAERPPVELIRAQPHRQQDVLEGDVRSAAGRRRCRGGRSSQSPAAFAAGRCKIPAPDRPDTPLRRNRRDSGRRTARRFSDPTAPACRAASGAACCSTAPARRQTCSTPRPTPDTTACGGRCGGSSPRRRSSCNPPRAGRCSG